MAITWTEVRKHHSLARAGKFQLSAEWGRAGEKFVSTVRPLGLRVTGHQTLKEAQERAEADLDAALRTAAEALRAAAP